MVRNRLIHASFNPDFIPRQIQFKVQLIVSIPSGPDCSFEAYSFDSFNSIPTRQVIEDLIPSIQVRFLQVPTAVLKLTVSIKVAPIRVLKLTGWYSFD
ncbi:hypothetical protein L1887_14707 [Cichorium endivia]|nr:hypothetical protein L1887_14707 [Cichorium endivia]